jgi:hypothetical protein
MPTSATGVYTLPVGAFVPGDLIKSADMNSDFSDIATALTGRLCVNGANGMAGAFLAADGTAAVPGISFAANPTTGFFRSGAGQFQWVSQGVSQGTFGTGGLAIAGTLNVVGTTTLGTLNLSGTLITTNINVTNLGLTGTLTPPLSQANGGTPIYVNNAASGGSANAQTLATASTIPTGYALATGSLIQWNPGFTNTGALTLAPNGLAATSVFKQTPLGAAACTGGETVTGQLALAAFDGTRFQLLTRANPSTVSTRSFATMGAITYTPTAGCVKARVAMQGPGGGSVGTAGGDTSLGTWTTIGGGNGSSSQIGAAGTGGANGSGSLIKRVPGQAGSLAITTTFSAMGGSSFLGHAQPGYGSFATGTGYGAGAQSFGTVGSGGGGEYAEFWIFSPATMTGVVGTSGAFNGTYTSTPATPGAIFIEEFFA